MKRLLLSFFTFSLFFAVAIFSPLSANAQSNQLYVSNGGDNTISVLDPSTGSTIATIPTGDTPRGIIFNGAYVYVVNANGGSVTVINPTTNSVVTTIQLSSQPSNGANMALSPDKKTLYVSDVNSKVYVINTTTNTVTTTIDGLTDPDGLAVTPDGTRLYVANQNCCSGASGFVSVLNTSDYSIITTIPVGPIPAGITMSTDGSKLYVTSLGYGDVGSNSVYVIDTSTNTVTNIITGVASPYSITLNHANTRAYVAGNNYFTGGGSQTSNAYVTVIDLETNSVITQIPVGYVSDFVAISSDDSTAYSTNQFSNSVSVIDTASNTVTNTFNVGNLPWGVALIPAPNTPPTISLQFTSNGSNGWFTTSPATGTVTATTSGNNSVSSINCSGATLSNVSGYGTSIATGTLSVTTEGSTTVSCTATDNSNNTSSPQQVTVNLDSINPTCTVNANPSTIWPPNHKLVNVATTVTPIDNISSLPANPFLLNSVTSNDSITSADYPGFILGTAATNGQLLSEDKGRTYTFNYQVTDNAGLTNTCSTTVTVTNK